MALTLIDVVAAAVIAATVYISFGATAGQDSSPPVCFNTSRAVVSCSLTWRVVVVPVFVVVLLALSTYQLVRWRRYTGRQRFAGAATVLQPIREGRGMVGRSRRQRHGRTPRADRGMVGRFEAVGVVATISPMPFRIE